MHDPSVLPHMHSEKDIKRMFPTIPAAPGPKNSEDYIDARRYYGDVDIVANANLERREARGQNVTAW